MLTLLDAKILCYLMCLIYLLHSSALLRSIIRKMDVSRLIRLLTYTKYAVYGRLCPKLDNELCKMPTTNVCKLPCHLLNLYECLSWLSRSCIISYLLMLPDYAVKAVFFSFISTLKYLHILVKVLIGKNFYLYFKFFFILYFDL